MANPNTMEDTDSFTVKTLTAYSETIDTLNTGFGAKMQDPADLTVKEFNIQSTMVGLITHMTVTLILPTVYEA